jgi:hypothetical protein
MNITRLAAWTTPSKSGTPSRSHMREMMLQWSPKWNCGRRAGEIRHDQGRRANTNLQQAQDPGQQDSKLWKHKMNGSWRRPTHAQVIYGYWPPSCQSYSWKPQVHQDDARGDPWKICERAYDGEGGLICGRCAKWSTAHLRAITRCPQSNKQQGGAHKLRLPG